MNDLRGLGVALQNGDRPGVDRSRECRLNRTRDEAGAVIFASSLERRVRVVARPEHDAESRARMDNGHVGLLACGVAGFEGDGTVTVNDRVADELTLSLVRDELREERFDVQVGVGVSRVGRFRVRGAIATTGNVVEVDHAGLLVDVEIVNAIAASEGIVVAPEGDDLDVMELGVRQFMAQVGAAVLVGRYVVDGHDFGPFEPGPVAEDGHIARTAVGRAEHAVSAGEREGLTGRLDDHEAAGNVFQLWLRVVRVLHLEVESVFDLAQCLAPVAESQTIDLVESKELVLRVEILVVAACIDGNVTALAVDAVDLLFRRNGSRESQHSAEQDHAKREDGCAELEAPRCSVNGGPPRPEN